MALPNWQVLQNENLPIRIGKNSGMVKADNPKPLKTGLGDRKALRDLSNTGQPSVPAKSKGSALRDISNTGQPSVPAKSKGSALRDLSNTGKPSVPVKSKGSALRDISNTGKSAFPTQSKGATNKYTIRTPEIKNAAKFSLLNEYEIRKCEEWAKEGIELAHFTGNDLQMYNEKEKEERVKKKAQGVISSLREWSNATYDLFPVKEAAEIIDVVKMEMVPEEDLLCVGEPLLISGDRTDDLFEDEFDRFPFLDCALELKLKEESCF